MPKQFYLKEILNNPFIGAGRTIEWQHLPGNRGLLETEDETLIRILDEAAQKQIGGIVKLTEAQFAEKKSLAQSTPFPSRPKEMLRQISARGPFPQTKSATAALQEAAAAAGGEPANVESTIAAIANAGEVPASATIGPTPPIESFKPATRRLPRRGTASPPATAATSP